MNEKEMADLFFDDPEGYFRYVEGQGATLSSVKKLKLGKLIATEKYPELVNEDIAEAAEFMFWFSYFIEREIRDTIFQIEIQIHKKETSGVDSMLDEMTFNGKLKFIKDSGWIKDPENDAYMKILVEIKQLRNHMAHGRLDKLEYGGYKLSNAKGQLKLMSDVVAATGVRRNTNLTSY